MSINEAPAHRHAAFLSGINLGKRRLKMDELRRHFEGFGLDGVATFIASGNVVFDHSDPDSRALEPLLERHLEDALGFSTHVFVRAFRDLARISALREIEDAAEQGFNAHAIFLRGPLPEAAREALAALGGDDDRFLVEGAEAIWLRRGGLSDAPITLRELNGALGDGPNTMRNLNTLRRMLAKFAGE